MRVLLCKAPQTLVAKKQPEKGSEDFQSKKNRWVPGDKHPSIGEQGEGREADSPQKNANELRLALEPLLALLMKPSACCHQVPHGYSLLLKHGRLPRLKSTQELTNTHCISSPITKSTVGNCQMVGRRCIKGKLSCAAFPFAVALADMTPTIIRRPFPAGSTTATTLPEASPTRDVSQASKKSPASFSVAS